MWKSSSITTSIRTVDRARSRDVFISLSDLHLDGLSTAALESRLHFESVGQYAGQSADSHWLARDVFSIHELANCIACDAPQNDYMLANDVVGEIATMTTTTTTMGMV